MFNGLKVDILIDADLHVLGEGHTVVVGGEMITPDVDLISIGLDYDSDGEITSRKDTTVAIILFWEPLVMDVTATGYVVVVYIHSEPEAYDISGIVVIVYGDEVNVEGARVWGYSIDVDNPSRQDVVELTRMCYHQIWHPIWDIIWWRN